MNSSWIIDEFYPIRSGINSGALSRGLLQADEQIKQAKADRRIPDGANILRLFVMHHPITGNEKIIDDAFLERLQQSDFRLCLHGHVHENRAELFGYIHPTRRMYVVGAGSFGAPVNARPESTPRHYNVLEVARDHSKIRVHTRALKKAGGAWEGWAIWPSQTSNTKSIYYDIILRS
jgi:hypothetical protein